MPEMQIGHLTFQLNRKAIKNLHISVLPPDGLVRISAPEKMTETAIRMAVISRIPWIKKQQESFQNQPRQSDREMVTGECHYLWGRRCRLVFNEYQGKQSVKKQGRSKLVLTVKPDTSVEKKAELLSRFYRTELQLNVEKLFSKWTPILGVEPSHWQIRKMKTKWGSCNTTTHSINLNLELAKKPPECLEYILVHELIHLLERHHNERFKSLMDQYLPDWRERRNLLNSLPLAYDRWGY